MPDVILVTTSNRDVSKFWGFERDNQLDSKEFVAFCDSLALDLYSYTLSSTPYPEISKFSKQYTHIQEGDKEVVATFMAVFSLKTRA